MTTPRIVSDPTENLIHFGFDGSIAVELYDLMFHDVNDVKPASSQADGSSELLNQQAFAPKFAGLAGAAKLVGDLNADVHFPIITDAVVEMDCVSATFEVGDLLAIKEDAGGTFLEDQKLVKTTDPNLAIGKCVRQEIAAATRVRCRLTSRYMPHEAFKQVTGQHTTVAASDTVITGLRNVAGVSVSLDDDPIAACAMATGSIGDQAGTPNAGSVLVKTWKPTATADTAPIAATTFGKKVNWVAWGS